ncbi:MAG: helicase [bacterium]|nr:MAG: helicase [bacterium]
MTKISIREVRSIKEEKDIGKAAVDQFFSADGRLSSTIKGYEYRPEQEKMAHAVADALFNKKNCLIDAPTGIGKTAAYLIAAIIFSNKRHEKVVISTNTINLQEQLFKSELPMLKKVLFKDLRFSVFMGRNRYICLNKFYKIFPGNVKIVEKMEHWIKNTKTGIKSDQTILTDSSWDDIASDSDTCIGKKCKFFQSDCFYYKAKRFALNSDIIVTNHHLLISDFLLPEGRKILPEHLFIVWDEAHHISDVATNQFGGSVSTAKIALMINKLIRKNSGILHLLRYKMAMHADDQFYDLLNCLISALKQLKKRVKLIEVSHKMMMLHNEIIQIDNDNRETDEIKEAVEKIIAAAKPVIKAIDEFSDDDSILFEKMRIITLIEKFADIKNILKKFQFKDERFVCCIKHSAKAVTFQISPIDVSDFLHPLFAEKTNILTSATLKAGQDFSFIKQNIGLENPEETELKSEFDWNNQVKAFMVEGISPLDKEYSVKLEDAIIKIAAAVKGGILILFTSHAQMNKTYDEIWPILEKAGKNPIIQGTMPRYKLFEIMRKTESILFGTSSFWEGVDIPGDNLSAVIITHLPFQSNRDPVINAKMKYYETIGLNSFTKFLLPDMMLKLRQGVGRLVRKRTDRGVIVFLDYRMKTKSYGKTVSSSFQFDVKDLSIDKTIDEIKEFYE